MGEVVSKVNPKKSINTARKDKEQSMLQQETSKDMTSSKEGYSFRYNEDGRRCHGNEDAAYMMPNDDDEADRLHQQHWVLRYVLQRNYHAPVTKMLDEGIIVLDSACGPGTWIFELAEAHPKSKFYGIDITGVFPERIMPSNVEFLVGNVTKTIPFEDNTFDYIHQRLVVAALTDDNWKSALNELYRVLKPGGYIELQELSIYDLENVGPCWSKLRSGSLNLFGSLGMPLNICRELEGRLLEAGFKKQVLTIKPIPVNHDGKRGKLFWDDMKHAYRNIRPALAKIYPEFQDVKVFDKFIDDIGIESTEYKTNFQWYACYAQKPLQ